MNQNSTTSITPLHAKFFYPTAISLSPLRRDSTHRLAREGSKMSTEMSFPYCSKVFLRIMDVSCAFQPQFGRVKRIDTAFVVVLLTNQSTHPVFKSRSELDLSTVSGFIEVVDQNEMCVVRFEGRLSRGFPCRRCCGRLSVGVQLH